MTYPSQAVQEVLERGYERVLLDVEKDAQASKAFAPQAIPVAIILSADGIEIARYTGFAPPEQYAAWLKSLAP